MDRNIIIWKWVEVAAKFYRVVDFFYSLTNFSIGGLPFTFAEI